jgi:hypothetical protein
MMSGEGGLNIEQGRAMGFHYPPSVVHIDHGAMTAHVEQGY